MAKYQDEIWRQYFETGSWRDAANQEPYKSAGINFATLRRYANGDPVYNHGHRKALGLPYKELVDSCPECGEVHEQYRTCNKDRGKRKRSIRPPSTEIRKDDATVAAGQIVRNCHFNVADLIVELSKQLSPKARRELKERL